MLSGTAPAHSSPFEPSPRETASYVSRSRVDRRKTDGFPPAGLADRRVRPERRGIQLVEFEFDERISIGTPVRHSDTR